MNAVVGADGRLKVHLDAIVELVITLSSFHDRSERFDMTMAVDVVLPVLWNQIFRAWLVCTHVMALPISRGFLQDVAHIKRRKIRIRLEHQGDGPRHARRGHARSAEGHVPVARVVLGRHHV